MGGGGSVRDVTASESRSGLNSVIHDPVSTRASQGRGSPSTRG